MLTTFIIICVVFCLIAMAAVALPLWFGGRKAADAEDRHETILGILRQQAADLEKEREAGRIDLDEYEESRLELERRVLEETARDTDAARSQMSFRKYAGIPIHTRFPLPSPSPKASSSPSCSPS